MQCPGDLSERCGGELRMNIWSRENTYGSFNALDLSLGSDFEQGVCYFYRPNDPPLTGQVIPSDDEMSLEYCRDACIADSTLNNYYAVQGGNTCMCGIEPNGTFKRAVPQSKCDTLCSGDAGEICGAAGFFNFYKINNDN